MDNVVFPKLCLIPSRIYRTHALRFLRLDIPRLIPSRIYGNEFGDACRVDLLDRLILQRYVGTHHSGSVTIDFQFRYLRYMGTILQPQQGGHQTGLDTFKDIWERVGISGIGEGEFCLDTFKDIWEHCNPSPWNFYLGFRYLQGYMGTNLIMFITPCMYCLDTFKDIWERFELDAYRAESEFRYLQGYMGTT